METNTNSGKKIRNGKAAPKKAEPAPVAPSPRVFAAALTMQVLTRMDGTELDAVYRQGLLPTTLSALDGAPDGRVLALVGRAGRGWLAQVVRHVAAARFFPWQGKSFEATGEFTGNGKNRLRGVGEVYPFATRVVPSEVDGQDCVVFDYDRPTNPFFIRAVRDELREVSPGLFMGPAMVKWKGRSRTVLWFAIDKTGV